MKKTEKDARYNLNKKKSLRKKCWLTQKLLLKKKSKKDTKNGKIETVKLGKSQKEWEMS